MIVLVLVVVHFLLDDFFLFACSSLVCIICLFVFAVVKLRFCCFALIFCRGIGSMSQKPNRTGTQEWPSWRPSKWIVTHLSLTHLTVKNEGPQGRSTRKEERHFKILVSYLVWTYLTHRNPSRFKWSNKRKIKFSEIFGNNNSSSILSFFFFLGGCWNPRLLIFAVTFTSETIKRTV